MYDVSKVRSGQIVPPTPEDARHAFVPKFGRSDRITDEIPEMRRVSSNKFALSKRTDWTGSAVTSLTYTIAHVPLDRRQRRSSTTLNPSLLVVTRTPGPMKVSTTVGEFARGRGGTPSKPPLAAVATARPSAALAALQQHHQEAIALRPGRRA